jgi:beta-glucosidase
MTAAYRVPDAFLWGAATSGHQVEGDNRHSDWWAWEESGRLPYRSGKACRHLELYPQDFALARSLGHNAHRLGIEWARIEPEPGRVDEAALDHYAAVLASARADGLEPVVTLHHFVAPAWFTERGGWQQSDAPELFAAHVGRVARAFAGKVRWWITFNEPTVWAKHAYVTGDWPPCVRGQWGQSLKGLRGMMRAHRLAHAAIHAVRADAMVGFTHSAPNVVPSNPASPLDRVAARLRDYGLNDFLFRLLGASPRRWLDFLGVNYYCRQVVRWAPRGRAVLLGEDDLRPRPGETRRFSDIGWEIWAPGFTAVLRKLSRLGVPLLVTENGIATDDEALRAEYLVTHLHAMGEAMRGGVDVRGYLYWSLLDNYEWTEGFAPHFGLCAVDYATQERRPRPIASLYAETCRSGMLPA